MAYPAALLVSLWFLLHAGGTDTTSDIPEGHFAALPAFFHNGHVPVQQPHQKA